MEGFKQFKSHYNIKNTWAARNDPNGAYPSAEMVYQAVKGPVCMLRSFDGLSLDDFISSGSVAARRCSKCLSLAPYYTAQMKRCTQKWDRCDDQGPNLGTIDTCHTGGKGWCPGPVHHKYITRKWTKYQANTHPTYPKFIQNFPSQFSCNFPSTENGQYIHSVSDHVTGISPLGKSWECSKFSQRM